MTDLAPADSIRTVGRHVSLSLYTRAMLWIGASLAFVTALSVSLSVHEKRVDLNRGLIERLRQASAQQAIAVSDLLWKLNREGVEIVLKGMANDLDFIAVRLLDDKGRVFASVGPRDIEAQSTEINEAPVVLPAEEGSRQIGTLLLYFSRARLEAVQREVIWHAWWLGMLQLGAVLLATAIALRAVIKPLEAITDRMLAVAGGDVMSPIPFKERSDQLGNIAHAVEVFAREMQARRQATRELELAQQQLEQRIEDRTRALRQSEERFRNLFDHSPLPKWVYSKQSLRFLEVNDAAVSKYGYSREEFLSMTIMDIRPPEQAERLRRWLQSPDYNRHPTRHWQHRRKDGQISDVEIYLRDIEYGGESARFTIVIDITERRKAEREIQRLFETSQDLILVTDGYGKILQVAPSSAKILGYEPKEMVGRNGTDFTFPEDLEPTRAEMRAARVGSATRHFRCRYVHKDGDVVALVWMLTWSESDRRHFFIGRDMTDHDHTEQQLRQAQKMEAVGQLTGGVAHDFNNILMVIMANVDALEDEQQGLDKYLRDRVQSIGAATKRAADLTRRLLAFSRKQQLRPQLMSVNDLVANTGKLLRRTLSEQIEIDSVLADDLWNIEVDVAQLESALVNLSINARDAMPDGGRLLIETKNVSLDEKGLSGGAAEPTVGDYVMLAVTDNGTGMPPQVMSRVFEPFFTTKGVGKGTGLGLSMIYGFVKQSNGHVRISSEVGQGTTIRLYLPRSDMQLETTSTHRPKPMPLGKETILVVEDDAAVRDSIVRQLASLGYAAEQATDGASGLAAFATANRPFDLLLTDVIMPGDMNGRMLADEVAGRWPSTKVVFMSGYTENAMARHGRLDEKVLLVSKPFRKRDLAEILRRALDPPAVDKCAPQSLGATS